MRSQGSKTTQIYRQHEDTDRLLVEVALDRYEDIFNEWDPAPFKRRDLDPDLQAFFAECSEEISLRHPLAIAFFLPKDELDLEKQAKCIEGLRNYFSFNKYLAEKQLKTAYKNALRYFLTGFTFIIVAVLTEHVLENSVFSGILHQGLFIGGWVFAWEAVSTIAFKNQSIYQKIAEWERFLDAPIVFKKERRATHGLE